MSTQQSVVSVISALARFLGSPPRVSASDFVTLQGRQFVAPNGQSLFLKGINLGNWLVPEGYIFKFKAAGSPRLIDTVIKQLIGEAAAKEFWAAHWANYITQADIRLIKRLGFNSVRIPFSYRLFVTEGSSLRLSGIGYELLDRVIQWCREAQVYVVLDMHVAPGGQTGDNIDDSWGYPFLYDSPESQELTIRIWQDLAKRYRNEAIVIGYDLLNEPIAHFFDTATLNPKLEPLYKRIVAAIRQMDRNHIIFLGGAQWNSNFSVFGPPFDPKLAYTLHKYWTETTQESIQPYVDFSQQRNVPLWLGESGENTDEWINSLRLLLEKNSVSWCFWTYKKMDSTSCVVSVPSPPEWGAIAAFADHPRTTFEEVRQQRPPQATVTQALSSYVENIKLHNCTINSGFVNALGLSVPAHPLSNDPSVQGESPAPVPEAQTP